MTYKSRVTVPRITVEMAENILNSLPESAKNFISIPVINSAESAKVAAKDQMTERLRNERYEYVSEVLSVALDEDGAAWTVTLQIDGD